KINTVLADSGLPAAVCVAYVSELIVGLPSLIEINGVDLVIQGVPADCSSTRNEALFSSMISSMTAAAFAAARVADGTTEWLDTENSGDLGSSGEDEGATDSADEKPRGFFSRIQQFFERLTTTAEKIDFDNDNTNPFVDQESKERVAYMIDSVIAQASIILRNVNIRVECELGLPGLNRASGVALSFAYLSVTNQQSKSTDGCAKADPENARSYSVPGCKDSRSYGDGWSWLWRWGSARKTDSSAPPTGSDDVINPPGSLSTMLHKNVHLEGVEVFWDLWDTRKQQDCQDSLSSVETSNVGGRERRNSLRGVSDDLSSPGRVPKVAIVYPTEENMVASAKLLTLTGVHTARVSVRCPLFSLNQTRPTEAQGDINSPEPQPTNPWSLFELRIHLDLGAIVACVCPSQFYWLQLLVARLSHIWNKYTEQVTSERTVQQFPAPNPRSPAESSSFFPNSTGPVESRQLSGLSRPRGYPESTHYTLPHGFSEAELVDLDLNHDIPSPSTMTSPLVDSKLFWSCLTETDEMTSSRGMETTGFPAAGSDVYNSSAGHTGRRTETSEPRFSVTANVLCVALVAFYEDESASSMSKIPLSKQSEMCTSVGPASRRSHISQRLSSYGSYYPNKPSATKESLDDATDTGLTRSFSSQYDVSVEQLESQCEENKENTTPSESTLFSNVQNMATLPGPFIFFSRFAGLMPWRQTVQSQRTGSPFPHRSTASQSNCSSSTIEGTAPMRIDRNDVDTGTLTPAAWVSQLRSQFAELASPRDHICFVGGLWHMEVCSRSVTADEMTGVQKPFFSNELLRQSNTVESSFTTCTQLDFGAHLFGIELSECLFPDEPCSDLNIPDPVMVRLLVFPDRARSTGDRSVRGPSESAAVKCNGLFHLGLTVPSNSGGVQPIRNAPTSTPVDTLHLDSAVCHIDVDISLSDRIHRITDAVAAASEAVAKFLPVGLDTSTAKVPRWQEDLHHDVDHYGTVFGLSTKNTTQTDCSQFRQHHKTAPSVGLNSANAETQYDASNHRLQLDVKCAGFEFFLRFPIPLEAIRLPPSQKMSDLRKTLWNSGTPLWFSRADLASDSPNIATTNDPTTSPNSVGLAWWRRTLRREYLRIVLSKLNLGYRTPLAEGGHGQANRGAPLQTPTTAKVNPSRGASDKQPTVGLIESANEPEIRISLRSMSVYLITPHQEIQANPLLQLSGSKGTSDFIGVSIHFSPLGRQELVERPNDKAEFAAYGGEPHVYTYAHERFEMGVDLASNPTNPQPQVHNPTSTASDQSIAWSLWKRTGPQNNPNVPFVIRRYFLQDAPKAHSKQTTYYPADSNHMVFYRQSANMNTRLSIRCKVTAAVMLIENQRTVELAYLRQVSPVVVFVFLLMYDILLWSSLLPSDRRFRAALTRKTLAASESQESREYDHRYWFLSDPAPLASIYAHPDAARQAAALEESSAAVNLGTVTHVPVGLHCHPLYSEDEEDEYGNLEDAEDEFDAGVDSLKEQRRNVNESSKVGTPPSSLRVSHGVYDTHASVPPCGHAKPAHKPWSQRHTQRWTESDELDTSNSDGATTDIRKQSSLCAQLDLTSVEIRISLPLVNAVNAVNETVLLTASGVTMFAEVGHNGDPSVNYATVELGKLEAFFTAGPHGSSSADGSSTLGDGSSPTWWPGLVPFSWQSVGYPPPRPASSGVDPTPAPTSGPMLTLAVEHKQLKRIHASSGCPMYRDDLNCTLRLQNACLVHWPHIDSANPTTDSALPGWLARLIDVLGTPSAQAISVLLPGYKQPDTLLVQHIHLECVALTWATPEDCQVFGLPSGPIPPTDTPLKSIRAFVACETINFTVNAASEPESFNLLSPAPGMLIMAFLSNITMFLCPIYSKPPSTLQLNQPESVPSQFLRWLNVLKLSDCVCVAELDHLELRCFCSPMRVTQMVNSESVTSYLTRVDVRVTDNRCCLHTCADSIVALQRLIEVLAVSGASPQSRPMVSEVVSDTHNPQSVRSAMNSPSRFRVPVPAQSRSPLYKSSSNTQLMSGSPSSVEDLLQGAISDADSPHRSPCKISARTSSIPSRQGSNTPASKGHSSNEKTLSPEPRPCRTTHSQEHKRPAPCPKPVTKVEHPTGHPTRSSDLYPSLPPSPGAIEFSAGPQSDGSSASSSPNEFILVKPSMVPQKLPASSATKVQFKCLVPNSQLAATDGTASFEVYETHYLVPSSVTSAPGSRNKMHRLFTDPPLVYPRARWALTLYNFSIEWNLFGGTDILHLERMRLDSHLEQIPSTPELARPPRNDRRASDSASVPPKTPGSRGASAGGDGTTRRVHRFRHDRPAVTSRDPRKHVQHTMTPVPHPAEHIRSRSQTSHVLGGGGRMRDSSKCISIRLQNVYFRHATFPPKEHRMNVPSSRGSAVSTFSDPASRYILNVGSLVILDQVATSQINQLLYSHSKSVAGTNVPYNVDTPIFRAAVVCWRVATEPSPIPASPVHPLPFSGEVGNRPHPTREDVQRFNMNSDLDDPNDLELEAKISCQPLRINLDQNTLLFICEFQQLFTASVLPDSITPNHMHPETQSLPGTISTDYSHIHAPFGAHSGSTAAVQLSQAYHSGPDGTHRSAAKVSSCPRSEDAPSTGRPGIFIRKVTFYPDLPIRLDYHGRHLDLSGGSLRGILGMLLQLHNAEIIIPRRVYQRGYPSLDRLLEEMVSNVRSAITTQLPQVLATSIGPMHEVTQFLMGLWDLVYQPVQSLYRGSRASSASQLDLHREYWHTTDLDLITYDPSMSSLSKHSLEVGGTGGGFVHGLKRGTRSFSTSTLWATLQLSIQGVRAVQSLAETAYDLVTPGPALRSRQLRLRRPSDLREGFGNAVNVMSRGFQMVTEDLLGATRAQSETELGSKGPVGIVGDVIRQIPPTIVAPLVTGCEVTANILGGFRNQLRPGAKLEDEQKWKDSHRM
ncbi:autophagy-related protein 2 homolog B, partial [Clonorchis sinensis]